MTYLKKGNLNIEGALKAQRKFTKKIDLVDLDEKVCIFHIDLQINFVLYFAILLCCIRQKMLSPSTLLKNIVNRWRSSEQELLKKRSVTSREKNLPLRPNLGHVTHGMVKLFLVFFVIVLASFYEYCLCEWFRWETVLDTQYNKMVTINVDTLRVSKTMTHWSAAYLQNVFNIMASVLLFLKPLFKFSSYLTV